MDASGWTTAAPEVSALADLKVCTSSAYGCLKAFLKKERERAEAARLADLKPFINEKNGTAEDLRCLLGATHEVHCKAVEVRRCKCTCEQEDFDEIIYHGVGVDCV